VPTLSRVAALAPGRDLPERFRATLAPEWHGGVPLPQRGYARYVEEAARVLGAARAAGDEQMAEGKGDDDRR
jgi:hypothetical protein